MTAESQPIDHAEAGFSWCEVGSGAPLLFLHPIVGTRRYWDAQLSEFSTTRRCIALDAPGYGESSMVGDPLASSVTGRLVAFLDHLGLERVDVVGLSLGGMHAMHFAVHAPERVGRLVLADTSAAFGIDPEPWLAEWLAPARSGTPMREIAPNPPPIQNAMKAPRPIASPSSPAVNQLERAKMANTRAMARGIMRSCASRIESGVGSPFAASTGRALTGRCMERVLMQSYCLVPNDPPRAQGPYCLVPNESRCLAVCSRSLCDQDGPMMICSRRSASSVVCASDNPPSNALDHWLNAG